MVWNGLLPCKARSAEQFVAIVSMIFGARWEHSSGLRSPYLAWLKLDAGAVSYRNVAHAAQYLVIPPVGSLSESSALTWAAAHFAESSAAFLHANWYPLPLYIFFFEELQGLVHAIFPGWFDGWLIRFDFNFAGVHPSVWAWRDFSHPALNDFHAVRVHDIFLVPRDSSRDSVRGKKDRIAFLERDGFDGGRETIRSILLRCFFSDRKSPITAPRSDKCDRRWSGGYFHRSRSNL